MHERYFIHLNKEAGSWFEDVEKVGWDVKSMLVVLITIEGVDLATYAIE